MEDTKQKAKQWVDALRSGKYTQDLDYLFSGEGYCCLGVYAKDVMSCDDDLLYKDGFVGREGARNKVSSIYGQIRQEFGSAFCDRLIAMNDSGKSFLEIADKIEEEYLLTN